jgi:hypothetical protein
MGRDAGSEGIEKAATYLAERFMMDRALQWQLYAL